MKIRFQVLGNSAKNDIDQMIRSALAKKGYTSLTAFGVAVAEKRGTKAHGEMEALRRVLSGESRKIDPEKSAVWEELLGLKRGGLSKLISIGDTRETEERRPFEIDAGLDVTVVIKRLAKQEIISAEQLAKELLWLSQQ